MLRTVASLAFLSLCFSTLSYLSSSPPFLISLRPFATPSLCLSLSQSVYCRSLFIMFVSSELHEPVCLCAPPSSLHALKMRPSVDLACTLTAISNSGCRREGNPTATPAPHSPPPPFSTYKQCFQVAARVMAMESRLSKWALDHDDLKNDAVLC
jgi:hypothetical protein